MFVIYETYERGRDGRLQPRKRAQTAPVASFGLYVNILFSSIVFFDTNLCLIAHTAFNPQKIRTKTETEGGCDDTDEKGPKRRHKPRLGLGINNLCLITYTAFNLQDTRNGERWKAAATRKGSNDASFGS